MLSSPVLLGGHKELYIQNVKKDFTSHLPLKDISLRASGFVSKDVTALVSCVIKHILLITYFAEP